METIRRIRLSVRLDDPALAASINCVFVKTPSDLGYRLVWERKREKATGAAPDAES